MVFNEDVLRTKDLNLLTLLVVLFEEQNTARAAERLFVTQSAVSKGLKKLREQFDDPLFVRSKDGFLPTPKCTLLIEQMTPLLNALGQLYDNKNDQTAHNYQGEISISMTPALNLSIVDQFYKKLASDFPMATIRVENWSNATETALINNKVHLGINYHPLFASKHLVCKELELMSFRFVVRKGHPLLGQQVTFKDISRFPLVLAVLPNFTSQKSKLEKALSKQKLNANVILRSDNDHLCIKTIQGTDAIMPVNHIVASSLSGELDELKTLFDPDMFTAKTYLSIFYHNQLETTSIGKAIKASVIGAIREMTK
ncbi:LysR family transcriptional regulator [Vibrio astriarenae]|uniref:LysR family transcriptional regulator n=1 Tax=Vibrio astriarenae TaxID=1481923 RepID=UPI0037368D0F